MRMLDILYETVEIIEGARLAGVIGTDGVSVEMIMDEETMPHSYETAEIELGWLVNAAAQALQRMQAGTLYDMVLETEQFTYILSLITEGYYAVIGLLAGSDLTSARDAIHLMVERFQEEL